MRAMSCETQLRSALALPYVRLPAARGAETADWSLERHAPRAASTAEPPVRLRSRPPEKNLFRYIFE